MTFQVAVVYKVQIIIENICEIFPLRLPPYFGSLILIIACHISRSHQEGRMYFFIIFVRNKHLFLPPALQLVGQNR